MREFLLIGDPEHRVRDAGFDLEPGTDFIYLGPDPRSSVVLHWDGARSRDRGLPLVYAADPRRRARPLEPLQVERRPEPVPRAAACRWSWWRGLRARLHRGRS